jgi:hypothetical protein
MSPGPQGQDQQNFVRTSKFFSCYIGNNRLAEEFKPFLINKKINDKIAIFLLSF